MPSWQSITPTGCLNERSIAGNRLPVKGKRLRRAFGALDSQTVSCYPTTKRRWTRHRPHFQFFLVLRQCGVYTKFEEELFGSRFWAASTQVLIFLRPRKPLHLLPSDAWIAAFSYSIRFFPTPCIHMPALCLFRMLCPALL